MLLRTKRVWYRLYMYINYAKQKRHEFDIIVRNKYLPMRATL